MLQFLKQNKQVLAAAFTIFIGSMSTLLFFLGEDVHKSDYKANIVHDSGHSAASEKHTVENQYLKILSNEKEPFIVLKTDGNIEYLSKEFENITGYQKDMEGKLFFLQIHSEDFSAFLGAFTKVIQTKQPSMMVGPYRFYHKNSGYHLHMSAILPILEDEEIKNVIITTRNIEKSLPDQENDDSQNLKEQFLRDKKNEFEKLMAEKY